MRTIVSTLEENVINVIIEELWKTERQADLQLYEQRFLNSLLLRKSPKRVLEIGVAAGGSSVLILNAIKNRPDATLVSIDYDTQYFGDRSKKTGFLVDEIYPELKKNWKLCLGGIASEFIDEIYTGEPFDFLFLDTIHCLPGEVLNFLEVFPYLAKDCMVVLHDTNLHAWGGIRENIATGLLLKGKKLFLILQKDLTDGIGDAVSQ